MDADLQRLPNVAAGGGALGLQEEAQATVGEAGEELVGLALQVGQGGLDEAGGDAVAPEGVDEDIVGAALLDGHGRLALQLLEAQPGALDVVQPQRVHVDVPA